MSREDTRDIIAEYRKKLGPLVEDAELDTLMNRIEGYMMDVLESRSPEETSMDRGAFETISECLVRSGLAYEAKLEDSDGGFVLTATDITGGTEALPGERGDFVLGEFMQRLIEMKTGRNYGVEVTHKHGKIVFLFCEGKPSKRNRLA